MKKQVYKVRLNVPVTMWALMTEHLKQVLELHVSWLGNKPGGQRADLSGANLSGADLNSADLRGANLRGADLSGANLSGVKNISGIRPKITDARH